MNIKPRSVHDWEHLVSLFKLKFLCLRQFKLSELGRTRPYPREDLDASTERFHEKALDYYDPVADDVLIDGCFHGMI